MSMPRLTKFILATALIVGGVWLAAFFTNGSFTSNYVCTHCGSTKQTTRSFWIPSSIVNDTPISEFHRQLNFGSTNEHSWLFAQGSGGTIRCAIGQGSSLYGSLRGDVTAAGLREIQDKLGDQVARTWLSRILNPDTSRAANNAISDLYFRRSISFENSYKQMNAIYAESQN